MSFQLDSSDEAFHGWLAQHPTEDELREAYIRLEARRASLWTAGHLDSFRRDRYELDSGYVGRLVQLKWALANHWASSGQFDHLARVPDLA